MEFSFLKLFTPYKYLVCQYCKFHTSIGTKLTDIHTLTFIKKCLFTKTLDYFQFYLYKTRSILNSEELYIK